MSAGASAAAAPDLESFLPAGVSGGDSLAAGGLAALAVLFVVVAASGEDKARLAAVEETVGELQAKLSATEFAAAAERLAAEKLLALRSAESQAVTAAAVAEAVAAALEREGARMHREALSEALAAAAAQAASEGLLNAAQSEEIRASVAAAREELAAKERAIQAKSKVRCAPRAAPTQLNSAPLG